MNNYQKDSYRVAVVEWSSNEGISQIICDELAALGHYPHYIRPYINAPIDADVIFSYGPYGPFLAIPRRLAQLPKAERPVFVHWNTEGIPDLKIPWGIMSKISDWRAWLDRTSRNGNRLSRTAVDLWPLSMIRSRMIRYRYVGDYYYAYREGWLDVFADSSAVYAKLHSEKGALPTVVAPWGASKRWYKNLGLERDIDVLWMGKMGSKRRNDIINDIRTEIEARGYNMYVADGVENPFIFDEERTKILNRSKITLNIIRTWYDDNYSRFAMAAPNRSLIVSEPLLPHCPQYLPGVHYLSAPIEELANRIIYYIEHEEARQKMVDAAYNLVTTDLAFKNSIKKIMDAVDIHMHKRQMGDINRAYS